MLSIEVFLSTLSLRRATQVSDKADFTLWDISIHALLAESDGAYRGARQSRPQFLSTLSLRRATREIDAVRLAGLDFYPRSPCGERRLAYRPGLCYDTYFYPRSPCGERPPCVMLLCRNYKYFYPRSPCGERRSLLCYMIHLVSYFYPRSPCGERPAELIINV